MTTRTPHDFIAGESPSASTLDEDSKGWIATESLTSNVGSITGTETTLTGLTVAPTLLASRRVRIDVFVQIQSTVANDVARVRIKEDGTTIANASLCIPVTGGLELACSVFTTSTPSAGTHTYTVTVERISGSGTLQVTASSTAPCRILVTDIGPAS